MQSRRERIVSGITFAVQVLLQFVIKPTIQWGVQTLAWIVNNTWMFVGILLLMIFSFERNGVFYNDIPVWARELLVGEIAEIGCDGMTLMLYIAVGIGVLYICRAISPIITGVGTVIRYILSLFLFIGIMSVRLVTPTTSEFVTPDQITRPDLLKLAVIGFCILGVVGAPLVIGNQDTQLIPDETNPLVSPDRHTVSVTTLIDRTIEHIMGAR